MSSLFLSEPATVFTPSLLRRILGAESRAALLYAGDRMAGTFRNGEIVDAIPIDLAGLARGEVVVCFHRGIADLLRVEEVRKGVVRVRGDADPRGSFEISRGEILARVASRGRAPSTLGRWLRRTRIDFEEARCGRPIASADPAATVLDRYDAQAHFFPEVEARGIDGETLAAIRRYAMPGERVVVAGCGTGSECLLLAEEGFAVRGIDFSEPMLARAREAAATRGVKVEFVRADLRRHDETAGSSAAVFFTGGVYSYLPTRRDRIATLGRMKNWLAPGGAMLVSAQMAVGARDRLMLTLRWLAKPLGETRCWGDAHGRYLTADGRLVRSFLHLFTERSLSRETRSAGLSLVERLPAHHVYRPIARAHSTNPGQGNGIVGRPDPP